MMNFFNENEGKNMREYFNAYFTGLWEKRGIIKKDRIEINLLNLLEKKWLYVEEKNWLLLLGKNLKIEEIEKKTYFSLRDSLKSKNYPKRNEKNIKNLFCSLYFNLNSFYLEVKLKNMCCL